MAPIGWQVLAGLMVKALRSVIFSVVCRSNMALSSILPQKRGAADHSHTYLAASSGFFCQGAFRYFHTLLLTMRSISL